MKHMLKISLALGALLSADVDARCKSMWDTAKIANDRAAPPASIPLNWFLGIDIVRRKIDAQSDISTTLYLCESRTPNAFATRERGRNIVAITTGMYRLLGDDWHAYAAIVGHENAHLVLNHQAQRVIRGMALNAVAQHTGIPSIGIHAFDATFSRKEEYQSDDYGLRYALCAGFSPGGAIRMHKKLNSSSTFLHSHPSSKSRTRALQRAAKSHQRIPRCRPR